MSYSPIAIKRSHVLGEIYKYCEAVESIPVYLNNAKGELLGHVDESLGKYVDAFLFHLPEDVCKKLSTGHYHYIFDYEVLYDKPGSSKRIKLNYSKTPSLTGLPALLLRALRHITKPSFVRPRIDFRLSNINFNQARLFICGK